MKHGALVSLIDEAVNDHFLRTFWFAAGWTAARTFDIAETHDAGRRLWAEGRAHKDISDTETARQLLLELQNGLR